MLHLVKNSKLKITLRLEVDKGFNNMEKTDTIFIDVIVPLSVPNLFTYRVPAELNNDVAIGKRDIVQFGK